MVHRVTLIPGDGTGPELTEATRRVLEATGVEFDWDLQLALDSAEVPLIRLGRYGQLGWTSWIGQSAPPNGAEDLVLDAEAALVHSRPAQMAGAT